MNQPRTLKNLFEILPVIVIILTTLLTACATAEARPVAPTPVDVDGIRTQTASTVIAAFTQQAIASPTSSSLSRVLCQTPSGTRESPTFDRSDQGYFSGVLVISEYYTLLDSGLQEEAYKLLSPDAQKASPRNQYVQTQKKNLKSVQIITVEPLRVRDEQQGIKYRGTDLVNRINFYVQIRVSAEENTPASAQTGDLQTLYLTLVLTEPEHLWKIDTFATEFMPAPDYVGPIPDAAFFSGADQSYYDSLVAIGRQYTFLNHGFYEQAYQLFSSSSPSGSLEQYVANKQLFKIKANRVVKIVPWYPAEWQIPCIVPSPVNTRTFLAYIYEEGENGWTVLGPNGVHTLYINTVLDLRQWKILSVNTGQ